MIKMPPVSPSRGLLHFLFLLAVVGANSACASEAVVREDLPAWQEGYLDIHHISVAGDATLIIYPDGTRLLFDAGGSDKEGFEKRAYPLKAASNRPDELIRPGVGYADYIQHILDTAGLDNRIEYAVISHFDSDHYGRLRPDAPESSRGNYLLTGITDVDERIPIDILVDRGFPSYDYPVDLQNHRRDDVTFQNFLVFVEDRVSRGREVQSLDVGSTRQLEPKYGTDFDNFSVRGIKSNGTIYSPSRPSGRRFLFEATDVIGADGLFVENTLSQALLISYGSFDYFTGGDMTGTDDGTVPPWFDTETPVAGVVGEVDALALNHHGVRDATNLTFTLTLKPQVSVVHGRTSDHPGQEVVYRLTKIAQPHNQPSLFGTFIHPETKIVYGPRMHNILAPDQGHVVIRVYPPGNTFDVFVLDDSTEKGGVLNRYGPFTSRD